MDKFPLGHTKTYIYKLYRSLCHVLPRVKLQDIGWYIPKCPMRRMFPVSHTSNYVIRIFGRVSKSIIYKYTNTSFKLLLQSECATATYTYIMIWVTLQIRLPCQTPAQYIQKFRKKLYARRCNEQRMKLSTINMNVLSRSNT